MISSPHDEAYVSCLTDMTKHASGCGWNCANMIDSHLSSDCGLSTLLQQRTSAEIFCRNENKSNFYDTCLNGVAAVISRARVNIEA